MSSSAEDPAQRIIGTLVSLAGGYLRNTVYVPGKTCPVCLTTINAGYSYCRACDSHRSQVPTKRTADHVGFLTYAIEGRQSHYLMRLYKASSTVDTQEQRGIVGLLAVAGIYLHIQCLARVAGMAVTHWTAVPSLPAKPGEHPLHQILAPIMANVPEIPLTAAAKVADTRSFRHDHFQARHKVPSGSHVLVIDDTWTSGGHAQSAGLSVRMAGAEKVSILSLARYFKESYGDNAKFMSENLTSDYDPMKCPWSTAGCLD